MTWADLEINQQVTFQFQLFSQLVKKFQICVLGDFDDSPPEEEICTTQILKQNALATQLASLNKQLAQKEQYALVLNDQESKLKEVRKKYEDQFDKMESQMKSLTESLLESLMESLVERLIW